MIAIIYCRVSTQEQANKGYSLAQQEEACRNYVDKNGFKLGEIFIERGESAKTLNRPEFQKMLKHINKDHKSISLLVVWKLDRLTRDVGDYKTLESKLSEKGIIIHSVTETNDDSAFGKFNRNLTAVLAQFDNDQKSERTIAGMKQAVKEGRWCWKEPIGYKRVINNGRSIMEIDPVNSIYVKAAFDMAEKDMYTKAEILTKLWKTGLKDIKKDKLTLMLKNVLYIGKIKTSFFPQLVDAKHDPIISIDQFDKVQKILERRRSGGINKNRKNPSFPLKKILLCGICGARITGSRSTGGAGTKYAYYHCASHSGCSVRTTKLELEEKFYNLLNSYTLKDNALKATLHSIKHDIEEEKDHSLKIRKSIKTQLVLHKDRKSKLIDIILDGKIDEKSAEEKMQEIDRVILNHEGQLKKNELDKLDLEVVLKSFEYFCSNIGNWWLNSTDIKIKESIQSIVFPDKVLWDGKELRTGKTPLFMRISELSEEQKRQWYPRADSNG